jgi:hypothetical protein
MRNSVRTFLPYVFIWTRPRVLLYVNVDWRGVEAIYQKKISFITYMQTIITEKETYVGKIEGLK